VGLLDIALAPLRAVLGSAEHEVEQALPVRNIEEIQTRVLDTAEAIKAATETIEAHVEVIETLATSLPPLTQAVTELTVQLGEILTVIAPIAAVERDVGKAEHFFLRRRHPAEPAPGDAPPE
jgi:phage-related minor tail protein